eukprot:scaffold1972_cov265-Chaetoceros_neogracile.AAC.35
MRVTIAAWIRMTPGQTDFMTNEVIGCDEIRKALTDFSEENDDLGIEEVSSVTLSLTIKEIQRLYANLDWVDSVTKLEECDEFQDEESKSRYLYTMQGVDNLFELVYVIKAKPAQEK